MEEKKLRVIDFVPIYKRIISKKKLYFKVLSMVFVLSCVWIFPQPRYYTTEVTLAPEAVGENAAGSLMSLASSFGFNLGEAGGGDAIYPLLYPDLFQSPSFIVSLFDIQLEVPQEDGSLLSTDYYTYLAKYQKKNWLTEPFNVMKRTVISWIKPKKSADLAVGDVNKLNPFHLSKDDNSLVEVVKNCVDCSVDKKTNVTSIVVKDQNAVVSALLADSVQNRLQRFIIEYRTSKARLDYTYYLKLTEESKLDYEKAMNEYSRYCDANRNSVLQSYLSHRDELENNVQLKFQTYTAMSTQLQAARAKVQEKTPAFTTLKSATVPVKPAGPKRMVFVLAMLIVSFVVLSLFITRDIIFSEQIC